MLDRLLQQLGLATDAKWPTNVRYLNLNRPWKLENASVDVVYSHHVFEHLDKRAATLFLTETRRVLRPGGVIRLGVPDLQAHAREYLTNLETQGAEATDRFLHALGLQMPEHSNPLRNLYEQIAGYPGMHKTMYDSPSLTRALANHGFCEIRLCERGTSNFIPEIADVEFGSYEQTIYLEARVE